MALITKNIVEVKCEWNFMCYDNMGNGDIKSSYEIIPLDIGRKLDVHKNSKDVHDRLSITTH